jgi:hypothetical protein
MKVGQEVVLDYNLDSYWVAMEKIIKDHQIVSGLQKQVHSLQLANPIENWSKELPPHVDLHMMREKVTALGARLWGLPEVPDDKVFKSAAAKLASAVELFSNVMEGFETKNVQNKMRIPLIAANDENPGSSRVKDGVRTSSGSQNRSPSGIK